MRWTPATLAQSTYQLSASRAHGEQVPVKPPTNVLPYAGTKSCLFHWVIMGTTVRTQYDVYIMFYPLDISEKPKSDLTHFKVQYNGTIWYVEKPDVMYTNVRVRCRCRDFYYRFAWWNYQQGCLFGTKPKKYKRKTTTRKTVNPNGLPGACKHILSALQWMQENSYTQVGRGRR